MQNNLKDKIDKTPVIMQERKNNLLSEKRKHTTFWVSEPNYLKVQAFLTLNQIDSPRFWEEKLKDIDAVYSEYLNQINNKIENSELTKKPASFSESTHTRLNVFCKKNKIKIGALLKFIIDTTALNL